MMFLFIACVCAMEDNNPKNNTPLNPEIAIAREELDQYLKVEKILAGNLGYIIFKSLKDVANGNIYPYYFGIQTSSTLSNPYNNKSVPSFLWDWRYVNQNYDREDEGKINNLNKFISRKALKNVSIEKSVNSTLKSDNAKIKLIDNASSISKHIDTDRSIYEAIRTFYKSTENKKIKEKNFSIQKSFGMAGFNVLKTKKSPHFLEQIMVSNFQGLLDNENKLSKNVFSFKALEWINKIFDMVASLEIEKSITANKSLEENQSRYNTLCCLYEAYHHLMFVLLAANEQPIYEYADYKKALQEEDTVRLPLDIQNKVLGHVVTKSGMDAITKSFLSTDHDPKDASSSEKMKMQIVPIYSDGNEYLQNKDLLKNENIYFEVTQYLQPSLRSKTPVIISGITSALYNHKKPNDYNQKIITEVNDSIRRHQQAVLILDSTVQIDNPKENDPIYAILANQDIKKYIENGSLVVMLAKSFQKFATLGTQKMRAGDITVIGKQYSELSKSILKNLNENFDDLYQPETWKPELQWLTHLLKYNGSDELLFLELCRKAVDKFVSSKRLLEDKQIEVLVKNQDPANKLQDKKKAKEHIEYLYKEKHKKSFSMLFVKIPLEYRQYPHNYSILLNRLQSFGYISTGLSEYPNGIARLNIGLEPDVLLAQIKQYGFTDVKLGQKGVFGGYNNFFFGNDSKLYIENRLNIISEKINLLKEYCQPEIIRKVLTRILKDISAFTDEQSLKIISKINININDMEKKIIEFDKQLEDHNKTLVNIPINRKEQETELSKYFTNNQQDLQKDFENAKQEIEKDIKQEIGDVGSKIITDLLTQKYNDFINNVKKDNSNPYRLSRFFLKDLNIKKHIKEKYNQYSKIIIANAVLDIIKNYSDISYSELKEKYKKLIESIEPIKTMDNWDDAKKYTDYKLNKNLYKILVDNDTLENFYNTIKEKNKYLPEDYENPDLEEEIQLVKNDLQNIDKQMQQYVLLMAIYDIQGKNTLLDDDKNFANGLKQLYAQIKTIDELNDQKSKIENKLIPAIKEEKNNINNEIEKEKLNLKQAPQVISQYFVEWIQWHKNINQIFNQLISDATLKANFSKINEAYETFFKELEEEKETVYDEPIVTSEKIKSYYDELIKTFKYTTPHIPTQNSSVD